MTSRFYEVRICISTAFLLKVELTSFFVIVTYFIHCGCIIEPAVDHGVYHIFSISDILQWIVF